MSKKNEYNCSKQVAKTTKNVERETQTVESIVTQQTMKINDWKRIAPEYNISIEFNLLILLGKHFQN